MTDTIGASVTDTDIETFDPEPEPPAPDSGSKEDDVEIIFPKPGETITINGVDVRINRLKTREFLLLMRVFTAGFGSSLMDIQLDMSDREVLQAQVVALSVMAIPEAADEFIEFVQAVCSPARPEQQKAFNEVMEDPPIEALLDISEMVIIQEWDDLQALAGKAQAWWGRMKRMGNLKNG